jgi:competence protein ComEA
MQLKKRLKPYFSFTQNERRGLIVLILIFALVIIIRLIIPLILKSEKIDSIAFKTLTLKIQSSDSLTNKYSHNFEDSNDPLHQSLLEGERIDLNQAAYEELVATGLSAKVTKNILKYRKSGGVFHSISDLKRIYGVDSNQFDKVKNYLYIDQSFIKPFIETKR